MTDWYWLEESFLSFTIHH